MTKFKVGDKVRLVGEEWASYGGYNSTPFDPYAVYTVDKVEDWGAYAGNAGTVYYPHEGRSPIGYEVELIEEAEETEENDAMTKFKVGDRVRPIKGEYAWVKGGGVVVPMTWDDGLNWAGDDIAVRWDNYDYGDNPGDCHCAESKRLELIEETDVTNPSHYAFPGGAEVIDISQWLTSNAAQALRYIARSSRIDGKNKGDTVEDLRKARVFIDFELKRLGAQ